MIGTLDQKIEIERATLVEDGGGGKVAAWAPLAEDPEPFARVELKGGDEVSQGGGDVARQRATFTIRSRSDLKPTDRIRWGGYVWNIKALGRPVARARYQKIDAVAGELSR